MTKLMATTKFALIVLTSKVDPSITQYNDNSDDHHCLCNCLSRSTDKPFLEEEARRLSTLNDNTYKVIKTTDLTILKGFTEVLSKECLIIEDWEHFDTSEKPDKEFSEQLAKDPLDAYLEEARKRNYTELSDKIEHGKNLMDALHIFDQICIIAYIKSITK